MPLHSLRRNYARSRNGLATYRLLHDGIKLSTEQLAVADKAINGTDNLFITGSAGTGKSFLMQHVIRVLEETCRVAVTASTGMAAAHVGGSTLHSFAGIGCGIKPGGTVQELLATIQKNKRLQSKWNKLDVLFIDEISMVDSDVFSLVDQVGRGLRKRQDRPFGGLRLILSGDFFQLPPVQLGKLSWASAPSEPTKKGFAFECTAWNESNIQVLHLSESHRHHSDPDFASLLEEIRFGRLSKISLDILNKRNVDYTPPPDDKIKPTHIYCRNKDVDMENEERLRELPGREIVFEAVDSWNFAEPSSSSTPFPGKPQSKSYDDLSATVKQKAYKDMSLIAPKAIILKIGAQVKYRIDVPTVCFV